MRKLSSYGSLTIGGEVAGVDVNILVDTGSGGTIVSKSVYHRIAQSTRPKLETVKCEVVTVNDEPIPVMGETTMNLLIGGKCISQSVLVCDVNSDVMLGTNFMDAHECIVDFPKRRFVMKRDQIEVPLSLESSSIKSCEVTTAKAMVIPPEPEMIVDCGPRTSQPESSSRGLIEPSDKFSSWNGLLLEPGLACPEGRVVPVRVINPSNGAGDGDKADYFSGIESRVKTNLSEERINPETKQVDQNVEVGELINNDKAEETAENCDASTHSHVQNNVAVAPVSVTEPSPERSDETQTSEDVKNEQRTEPVNERVVEHTIDTDDARPCRQPFRRTPVQHRPVIEAEIKKMLAADVIEPANGPCNSNIDIGKKQDQDGSMRVCCDLRTVNKLTRRDVYQQPRPPEIQSSRVPGMPASSAMTLNSTPPGQLEYSCLGSGEAATDYHNEPERFEQRGRPPD